MKSKRAKQWLGNVAMLLVPVGALKLSAMYFSMSVEPPAVDVSQASTPAPIDSRKDAPVRPTPGQIKRRETAAGYVQATRAERFGPTPFYYEPGAQPVEVTIEPEPVHVDPDAPRFTVQIIMASDDDTKALIDGKTYRVGDEFRDGWIVLEINSFARTVTIADPTTDRTSTQAVKIKGER